MKAPAQAMDIKLGLALESYRVGVPVLVQGKDGRILHGAETLRTIKNLGLSLTCLVVSDIDQQEFEDSEWPEKLETAGHCFLKNSSPEE